MNFSYKPPYGVYKMHETMRNFTCRGCVETGKYEFGKCPHVLLAGSTVNTDAEMYYICDDCYRDLQREGKIW